jgi:hypothetical protein
MKNKKSTKRILRIYNIAAIGYDMEASLTGFSKNQRSGGKPSIHSSWRKMKLFLIFVVEQD